ncbi:MAG: hypothetical protein HN403_17070 [Rhodospirillales bacterium]|nr:hypothetical protein [Rhodospirillales bacterium]
MQIKRLGNGPIIAPFMDRRIGRNINGPSLIRVPDWLPNPLGRYYLYFADHRGSYIRMAYADHLLGPWRTHEPGSLHVAESFFIEHVASPDVHVDDSAQEICMYFHGFIEPENVQGTRVATSYDGIHFIVRPALLGPPYFRVFRWEGATYAWVMGGRFWRAPDGITPFEMGPECGFPKRNRHAAVWLNGDRLNVFYTCIGDAPERIYRSNVQLAGDWKQWRASESVDVLRPEIDWEGAEEPLEVSRPGPIDEAVNQLRDPAIFVEDSRTYLLYCVAGEHGIAIAEIT